MAETPEQDTAVKLRAEILRNALGKAREDVAAADPFYLGTEPSRLCVFEVAAILAECDRLREYVGTLSSIARSQRTYWRHIDGYLDPILAAQDEWLPRLADLRGIGADTVADSLAAAPSTPDRDNGCESLSPASRARLEQSIAEHARGETTTLTPDRDNG